MALTKKQKIRKRGEVTIREREQNDASGRGYRVSWPGARPRRGRIHQDFYLEECCDYVFIRQSGIITPTSYLEQLEATLKDEGATHMESAYNHAKAKAKEVAYRPGWRIRDMIEKSREINSARSGEKS